MNWNDIKDQVMGAHVEFTNRHGLAKLALESIEYGMRELEKLGHSIEVGFGQATSALQFPKMLVHPEHPGHQLVENSEQEQGLRAKGWKMQAEIQPPAQPLPSPSTP